jgi:bidirectional [NiFe] hydrogenase diaphorase subunit
LTKGAYTYNFAAVVTSAGELSHHGAKESWVMPVQSAKPAPPSDDKRWKMIGATMRRNGYAGHALIETLHSVQDAFGYLDEPAMEWVADSLNLPLSKVYGVATFYHLFTLKPQGKHTCVICTGTACYIKGADKLVEELTARFNVKPGGTTKDNKLSVLSARCVGACGLAPAAVLNGQMLANQSPDDLVSKIEELS